MARPGKTLESAKSGRVERLNRTFHSFVQTLEDTSQWVERLSGWASDYNNREHDGIGRERKLIQAASASLPDTSGRAAAGAGAEGGRQQKRKTKGSTSADSNVPFVRHFNRPNAGVWVSQQAGEELMSVPMISG